MLRIQMQHKADPIPDLRYEVTYLNLCNGGALYAPYSFLSISNILCVWGGQGGNGSGSLRPCFRVIKYGPISHPPRAQMALASLVAI